MYQVNCVVPAEFWTGLHRTYSSSRYCDLDALSAELQRQIFSAENLVVECSSYTVGEPAAFLRGTVTIGNEDFDFEVSFGSLYNEEMYDSDGQFTGGDEDEYYESVAAELFACSEIGGLTVYFTEA